MLTLYSYPGLFGVADNNPYGLKIYAFLKLCGIAFRHEQVIDARAAPRGQLPYIEDDGKILGDSDAIIAYLIARYGLSIEGLALDPGLAPAQRRLGLMARRTLDDLYWAMSYSRWKDDRYWPAFRDALLRTHTEIAPEALEKARAYNFQRYFYQGIGRYEPQEVYARGLADLEALAELAPEQGFVFGPQPSNLDAGLYGFVANILFYEIETPLRAFLRERPRLERLCLEIHARVA